MPGLRMWVVDARGTSCLSSERWESQGTDSRGLILGRTGQCGTAEAGG